MTELAETERTPVVISQTAPVPTEPAATEAPAQSRAWDAHPLDIRLSIPLGLGRYYLTIVAGKERRAPERLVEERRKHPLDTGRNLLAVLAAGCLFGLAMYGLQLTLGFWALEQLTVVH